jgi:3-oxoacyl-[acyl-carrier-protein] synthase II
MSLTRYGGGETTPPTIVGIGAVSGYGWGEKRLREGLYSGRSAVRALLGFLPWAPREATWVALADDGEDPPDEERGARALRFAAEEALSDARGRGWRPSGVMGLIHGADLLDVTWFTLAEETELNGPGMSMTAGAASGALALLTAKCWIDGGVADDVLVVCSDMPLTPERIRQRETAAGYDLASPTACRPFQQGSTGCNPGEAVTAMVVSRSSSSAYARVLGGAVSHGPAGERPDPSRLRRALERAMDSARVSAADISYLNANGSGVPTTDAMEAEVADELLDSVTGVYSLKPLVGDCGAAAGTLELMGALYGFATGVVPAPARLAPGHPRLLDGPTASVDGAVVKASIGSAGECAVVVVAPPD